MIFLSALKRILVEHKLHKFFLIGLLLMIINAIIHLYLEPWDLLLLPILILPIFIWNTLINTGYLNVLDVDNVRVVYLTLPEVLLFILLGAFCFSIITTMLVGNGKYRKSIYFIYLILFSRILIHEIILWLPPSFPLVPSGGTLGYFDLAIFLRIFVSSLSVAVLVLAISNNLHVASILKYFIDYAYLLISLLLGSYLVLAFIDWKTSTDASSNELFLAKISLILLGFVLFIVLESIRRTFKVHLLPSNLK